MISMEGNLMVRRKTKKINLSTIHLLTFHLIKYINVPMQVKASCNCIIIIIIIIYERNSNFLLRNKRLER